MGIWTNTAKFSFIITLILFIKDIGIITLYIIKRFIDQQSNPQLRPKTQNKDINRIQKAVPVNVKNYLMDQNDLTIDDDGNTSIHQLTNFQDLSTYQCIIDKNPQLMFLLNKQGFTPLDAAINEQDHQKALLLIQKMTKYNNNCILKFSKKAHKLELKFQKAYTISVLKNNYELLQSFPPKCIKTTLVCMNQVQDYKQYKDEKSQQSEMITSPLHLACQLSNEEAVRQLVENHSFDINLLVNEKSALYELVNTSCYKDFNILTYLMKYKKPCINSGLKLPLNQAIIRGNPFIIKTLIEYGKPNHYVRDINGRTAIHIATAKLDMETFDMLVQSGADPMIPDLQGNTILHNIVSGVIRDVEYDFIKQIIQKYNLRLTRNSENKTPLNIIRSYSTKSAVIRGQPNFKKKIQEFFEERIATDPLFIDSDKNEDIHEAIIRGNIQNLKDIIDRANKAEQDQVILITQSIETRNFEGKTALMLALEHERIEISQYLLDTFPDIDIDKQDTQNGNTALHIACYKDEYQLAQQIYDKNPRSCLKQNYKGQTPINIAVMRKNIRILKIFEQYKQESLLIKDSNGENPLFYAARVGDADIFNWFTGNLDFFRARGEQNYKGQTIEHILCQQMNKQMVEVIKPRPDTRDYYGNLPIYYSIMKNDVEMIYKHFKKGKDYFSLRNYKNESIFHIAAKFNSLASLQKLIGQSIFIEELVNKDYKGDTPFHTAAKNGKLEILEHFMSSCTKSFLEIQNDFGFTVLEAIQEKIVLLEDNQNDINEEQQDQEQKNVEKIAKLKKIRDFIESFDNYINEDKWNQRFAIPMQKYFEAIGNKNLKLFMEQKNNSNQSVASPQKQGQNKPAANIELNV